MTSEATLLAALAGAAGPRAPSPPQLRCRPVTTPDELQAQADAFGWYHTIDLGNGVVTKGISVQETSTGVIPDVAGRSVLDIGAWDGKFSFAAEKAGASRRRGPRSLCVGRGLRGPWRLLGRMHRQRHPAGPIVRRD